MYSRVPADNILYQSADGGVQASPSPAGLQTAAAAGKGGHTVAILPRAKADREKLRRTLMTELRRQLPAMLESSGKDAGLPERSLTVIRMLTRLDMG